MDCRNILQLNSIQWTIKIDVSHVNLISFNGLLLPTTIDIHPVDNKNCCCISNGLLLPTAIDIHPMDNKNCCCISNLLPDNVLVEKGDYYSPNSVIQDIMAFSHVLLNMSFLCGSYQWKRLFLHLYGVFWRLTIHRPQTSLKQHKKEENKRGSGVYVSPSERSRYSSKYIISLDELIVWMLYIV